MKDSWQHKGLRRKLVAHLRQRGIQDEQVLSAIEHLPRHFFLDSALDRLAYDDQALPIGRQQTISQPYTVAFQTELLRLQSRQKVLEIGTGSGYQAAILALLGGRVFTVERHKPLYLRAKKLLAELKLRQVRCFWRDGGEGLPEFAPYDRILVTAALPTMPEALLDQLATDGRLVAPVADPSNGRQHMLLVERLKDGSFKKSKHGYFRFVPFLPGRER